MTRMEDAKRQAEMDACDHVLTYGEIGIECEKCGKTLLRYNTDREACMKAAAEIERRLSKGFSR